jgi:hypothetical protein
MLKRLLTTSLHGRLTMARSFGLDNRDGDNSLTLILLPAVVFLSLFNLWIHIGITILLGPWITFFLTRWLYKRHLRKQLAMEASN